MQLYSWCILVYGLWNRSYYRGYGLFCKSVHVRLFKFHLNFIQVFIHIKSLQIPDKIEMKRVSSNKHLYKIELKLKKLIDTLSLFKKDKSNLKKFISKKFRILFFFSCILFAYVSLESSKEFWENSYFENTRAGFLQRCHNSLPQTSPEIMHFQAWKNKILTNIML